MKSENDAVGFRIDLVRVISSTPLPTPPGLTPLITFTAVGVCRFRGRGLLRVPINQNPEMIEAA
jgi:hypothetical protein